MSDRIEKIIELKAPIERVRRALTNHTEFGAWRHRPCYVDLLPSSQVCQRKVW
jgi:hypothetical protein